MKHAFLMLLLAGTASASMVQIPYSGGKQTGSFTITLNNGAAISPDTVRIGSVLTIVPYLAYSLLTVCNNRNEMGLQFHPAGGGQIFVRPSADTNWAAATVHAGTLSSSSFSEAVPVLSPAHPSNMTAGRGIIFARPGDWDCMTDTYEFTSHYRKIHYPVGTGVYAKVQITGFTQTLPGPVPPQYQPTVLNTITVRYLINESADIADPVSIRPERGPRAFARFGAGVEHDLYNPLGVRLRRAPGKFEAAVPATRPASESR